MNINNVTKIFALLSMSIMLFNSCSGVEVEEVEAPINSREYIETMVSGIGFGFGKMDDEVTVLEYIYNSEELCEKYGDKFEIGAEDISGVTDYETTFILGMKGKGVYSVCIKDDMWTVTVSKSYLKKWEVTDCYLSDEEWVE